MQSTAGTPIYNQHSEESCGHAVYTQLWPQMWNVGYGQNHTTHALQYIVHVHMYAYTDYKLLQDEQLDDTNDTPFSCSRVMNFIRLHSTWSAWWCDSSVCWSTSTCFGGGTGVACRPGQPEVCGTHR